MGKKPTIEQNRIIDCAGNIVVTAKPGSGKTYTIVEKIASILPTLPDYKGIIAISFTNKASDELKQRCKSRCQNPKQSFFGTIDKFYISQIIIPFASHLTGKIADYEIINDIPSDSKYFKLMQDDILGKSKEKFLIDGLREGKIFLRYTGETALILINRVPGVLKYIKAKYSHIFIDEYQDCGEIQNTIFNIIVENNVCGIAVGDINQAIYGFANRFPKYLLYLIKNKNFSHFELNKNHRCHESISEYSLCLFDASKNIPNEKRVFKVEINGNESCIASSIDTRISRIKEKYKVTSNNKIAILCRSNASVIKISESLNTPHKAFEETILDTDNSDWGRFFRELISSCLSGEIFATDYAEELFSEEYETTKYRKALWLSQRIFDCSALDMYSVEDDIISLAELVYPKKRNEDAISHLHCVLNDEKTIKNYIPALDEEINIMTLHKSKGLEFNIVFHLDMYKWIFPNEYASKESQLQDLNLHYVGVTRAKDVCYIINGTKRYRNKYDDYITAEPSPFFDICGLKERRIDVCWK